MSNCQIVIIKFKTNKDIQIKLKIINFFELFLIIDPFYPLGNAC